MSALRSSVRPKSSKQNWGTILQPDFGLGFQRMTEYEVEQSVSRLYFIPAQHERLYDRPQQASMSRIGIQDMLKRLTLDSEKKASDAKRTIRGSQYANMGSLCSYAWKGYN